MSKFNKENWYKKFFSKYYLRFFGRKKTLLETKKEVEFICRILNLTKKVKILDLACGFGRHAVKLAKRGFSVTCLDFNKQFLNLAKKLAKQNKVSLRTVWSDMRNIPYKNEFDAVINMFSSFGYFEKEKENLKVLKAVSAALKPNGLFLLDLPNKKWILTNVNKKIRRKINNTYLFEKRSFDKKKNIYLNKITLIMSNKKVECMATLLHLYEPVEIKKKLKDLGFSILKIYGDYDGKKFISRISPRMIVLARNSCK